MYYRLATLICSIAASCTFIYTFLYKLFFPVYTIIYSKYRDILFRLNPLSRAHFFFFLSFIYSFKLFTLPTLRLKGTSVCYIAHHFDECPSYSIEAKI